MRRKKEKWPKLLPSINLATLSLTDGIPWEWLYAPVLPPMDSNRDKARSMASAGYDFLVWFKFEWRSLSALSKSEHTCRKNVMGFCPNCWGFPILQFTIREKGKIDGFVFNCWIYINMQWAIRENKKWKMLARMIKKIIIYIYICIIYWNFH